MSRRRFAGIRAALWAFAGAILVLFAFFIALGGVDPGEAQAATIVVAVIGVVWLAHAWRRLWSSENASDRADRERRGF